MNVSDMTREDAVEAYLAVCMQLMGAIDACGGEIVVTPKSIGRVMAMVRGDAPKAEGMDFGVTKMSQDDGAFVLSLSMNGDPCEWVETKNH